MHFRAMLIISFSLCIAVAFAGCTQAPVPGNTSPASPGTATISLTSLVLAPTDLPPGYALIESRAKNSGDVGQMAKDLGWQGGYVAMFANSATSDPNGTGITQSLAVYPEKSIPDITAMVNTQDRSDDILNYTNLSVTGTGTGGSGFYGKAPAGIVVKPTNQNPLSTGNGSHDVEVVYPRDIVEVIFAKGTVFEVIRITGPGADPALAESLARTAYGKIP